MPKINREEYEVLKGLDGRWKWIARDSNQQLYAFDCPPNKSTLKEIWTTNWNGPYLLPHDLFQFINWEDEEPYTIAELIEEYEKESEENTMGKKELKEKVTNKQKKAHEHWLQFQWRDNSRNYYEGKKDAFSEVLDLIDQLDEPEVLSQKWIDERKRLGHFQSGDGIYFGYFIKAEELQNQLVPKQDKPKVPKWFDEWCKGRIWGDEFHEGGQFTRSDIRALVQIADGESLDGLTQEQGEEISRDFFKYLDAFHYGYEVEKEKKYRVKIPNLKYMGPPDSDGEYLWVSDKMMAGTLSEKEIKAIDERFWPFAVPVEEVSE